MKAKYGWHSISVIGIVGISIVLYAGHGSFYQKKTTNSTIQKENSTVIPVIFLCDEATENKSNVDLVENFNKLYRGKYYLDVEWFTGNAADYRARIKMLNSVNELPAIITDIGFDPALYKLLVKNKQIIDLAPYFREDLVWQAYVSDEIIDSVQEENGEIYLMPLNTTYYSGIFWNKELFKEAGIEEFPTTWEAFWEVCDKLQAVGITPISLHTEGTSWASMLLATSSMGQTVEGMNFMKQVFPSTYDIDVFYEMLEVYKKAFKYTTSDAIGRDFDTAESHFYQEETAMIPNGRWMIESLSENQYAADGFEEKISFASFPGDVLIGSTAMSGWAISANYDKDIQKGAIEFLKYRNQVDYIDTEAMLAPQVYSSYAQVLKDYFKVLENPFKIIPNYQLKWNSFIQKDVFNKELPELLTDKIDSEEFIKRLDEAIEIYNKESELESNIAY